MTFAEKSALRPIYVRWIVILIVAGVVTILAGNRYCNEVAALSPEEVMAEGSEGPVRVLGRVRAGTMGRDGEDITFQIEGLTSGKTAIWVRYNGKPYENLRELKTLVIDGEWNKGRIVLYAEQFWLIPNYGFIIAAYLLSLIPLGWFICNMERKVVLLSLAIKGERGYQPLGDPLEGDAFSPDQPAIDDEQE